MSTHELSAKVRELKELQQLIEEATAEAEAIKETYKIREHIVIDEIVTDDAFYSPSRDCVVLPLPEQFKSMEERYSTAFHELAHSTGHQSRLDRLRATARFGSESYSKEELVAEITAAALMNHTGIETKGTFRNSTAYIQNWLTALRNDKRLIISASGAPPKLLNTLLPHHNRTLWGIFAVVYMQ